MPTSPQAARSLPSRACARALARLTRAGAIDPAEAEFRLNSVWAGAWVTLLVCIPALIYALTGGGKADRAMFLGAWLVGLSGGLVSMALPWRRIIRSGWRELAFLGWTMLDLLLIGIAVVSDGGPNSPVTVLFLVPIVFVGASYPTWAVKFVCAIGVSGYAGLAIAYSERVGRLILVLGGLGGAALMSWWQAHNHERRRLELARASVTDPLTRALNRRGLDAAAAAELAALARFGRPVSLMLIDLDDFKAYNDANGHVAGDELLSWVAAQIRNTLRPTDALARIGGDEFAVLIAGADARAAEPLAERIRAACDSRVAHCTGIASAPSDGHDFDSLYRVADRALYQAKRMRKSLAPRPQPLRSLPQSDPGLAATGG